MITERTIINALIIGATFIVVPFVISSSLTVNYVPALLFGGIGATVAAFFFLKDKLCICPVLGGSVIGSLSFLPLPLNASELSCIPLILYYITGYVIVRQRKIKLGRTDFLWPILLLTGIVLVHNHDLHVHAMGAAGSEGGKPAILIFLTVLAYFCGINIRTPSVEFMSKIPLYAIVLAAISSFPFFLSTYIPGLTPYLNVLTNSVNVEAYLDTKGGVSGGHDTGGISRLGVFGPLGGSLELYLLCHYPIGTWWRPNRWWVAGLSIICAIMVVACGYRNNLFGFILSIMAGTWAYYSWRSLFLPLIVGTMALVLLLAWSDNIIQLPVDRLPLIAQRTLSFLPGNWDPEAVDSAKASNDFRENIKTVYVKEYMTKSPWFGNGFSINTEDFNSLLGGLTRGYYGKDLGYVQAKAFIEGKLFHIGWISLYDAVGIIGSLGFVVLAWSEIVTISRSIFGP
jgi:hypothetical protein